MERKVINGVVRTITDGIRDAGMQYDYACEARRASDTALAEMHIAEMQKRLAGVAEWYKKTRDEIRNDRDDNMLADVLIDDYVERYRELMRKCEAFRGE